jgi:hypothetical protein
MYSMALKPNLNSVQRRVVGYAMRMSFSQPDKFPVEAVAWDRTRYKTERKRGAVKRDFYRPESGRAHQSEPARSITPLKTNGAAPGC